MVLATVATVLLGRGDGSIALGRTTDYPPGEVVYHSTERLFVVHPVDGPVIVLSDLDPHNPPRRSSCRVTFRPDLGPADAPGRFFDACTGSVYDITGRGLADDGLDLRRVPVREDEDGRLRVARDDVAKR